MPWTARRSKGEWPSRPADCPHGIGLHGWGTSDPDADGSWQGGHRFSRRAAWDINGPWDSPPAQPDSDRHPTDRYPLRHDVSLPYTRHDASETNRIATDGGKVRPNILSHTRVDVGVEFFIYAEPVWLPDSSATGVWVP